MDSVEELSRWIEKNSTHESRYMRLLDRHVANLKGLVESFRYPVNTPEFHSEITRLWEDMRYILEDAKEISEVLASDYTDLMDVFESFRKEIRDEE